MEDRYWAFECLFVVNNNLLMAEVFAARSRSELIAAMRTFFRVPRAKVLLAEVIGAYSVIDGEADAFFDAMPFLKLEIAKEELDFDRESLAPVVGDLEGGGVSRMFLAKGRAIAVDAEEEDEDDDDDPVLQPFSFLFDEEGFLASLPDVDGKAIVADAPLRLVRPLGVAGWPEHLDSDMFGEPVTIGIGWWDAEPSSKPRRFDPKARFVKDRELPMM